jgi:hypothetical protein
MYFCSGQPMHFCSGVDRHVEPATNCFIDRQRGVLHVLAYGIFTAEQASGDAQFWLAFGILISLGSQLRVYLAAQSPSLEMANFASLIFGFRPKKANYASEQTDPDKASRKRKMS